MPDIADILDQALSGGSAAYREGRLAPYQIEQARQKAQRGSIENLLEQSKLEDLNRSREEQAAAPSAYQRLMQAYQPQAPSIQRSGTLDTGQNPEAAGTEASVTPGRGAARTVPELINRGASAEDYDLAAKYRPQGVAALGLMTPEAAQQKDIENRARARTEGLQQQLDALDPRAPDYAAQVRAVVTRMAAGTKPEAALEAVNQGAMSNGGMSPPNIRLPAGAQWIPGYDESKGRLTWKAQYPPNFNPGQITHEDATASLIDQGKLPAGSKWGSLTDQQHSAVVKELSRLQAEAAGDKATKVTIHTGQAKLDLPVGKDAQLYLNAKGEFPPPTMTLREVQANYQPYKDAVKRLDQEGASRTFLQHLQFLKEYADQFPESGGNAIGDKASAEMAALKRRALGKSDPVVAGMTAIDRPAALQMIRAVSPDARAGARLQAKFEEILNPYGGWTKQSYLAAVEALEKMALTGMAQRGRPGMTPQPGAVQVPPAATGERSPAPVVPGVGTPGPGGRIRVIGPNGEKGTVPAGTPLPAGWKAA